MPTAFLLRHLLRQVLFTSSISANGSVAVNAAGEVMELQKQNG